MSTDYTQLIMTNFSFAMFVLAVLITLLHKIAMRKSLFSEIAYRWFALFPLGLGSLYLSYMHAFYPIDIAAQLGWPNSSFQMVVAIAYLAFGLLAIFSFNTRFGFRLATVLSNTIWLWGWVVVQTYQLYLPSEPLTVSHMPSWLWLDFSLPIVLWLCLVSIKKRKGAY